MSDDRIREVRAFNRFHTRLVGALDEKLLASDFSLTQVRVLHELANHAGATAGEIRNELRLDAGYLSRMLRDFEAAGLVTREPSEADGRERLLALTPAGRRVFAALTDRANAEVAAILAPLSDDAQERLTDAMRSIRALLASAPSSPPVLRAPQAGDMGWVVMRHGRFYADEYGMDARLEALVAEIVGAFVRDLKPARERCWIAARDDERLGSIFLVDGGDGVAQLRLLLVEPAARGLGLGRRLVEECIGFARGAGYAAIKLWTNDILVSARRIYEAQGFKLIAEERHTRFGPELTGQTWELTL